MNKPIILIILSILIVSGNSFSQWSWESVSQSTQFSPTDIEFTDLNNGWAATISGYIAHTNDGGNSWSLQGIYDPYNGANSIDMLSATHGYATLTHKIIETTDGENWTELVVDTMNNYFGEINFLNDTLGIVYVTGSMIWKTTDGGQSWDTIFWNPSYYIGALQFVDENTIIAVGQDPCAGNIIVSHDGGLSWTEPQEAAGLWLTDVHFTSNLTGYIIGQNGTYLTTSDGGLTWQNATQFQSLLQPYPTIYFTTASTGFVTADYNQRFKTTDGGITWTDISPGSGNRNYTSIHFVDSLHGWAASSILTEIMATSDGGVTWNSIYAGSGWGLTDVAFSDNGEGWACGGMGTILHTIDNGNSWSLIESPLEVTYSKIEIITPQKIWIVGGDGLAFQTSDGGANWYVAQISQQGGQMVDIDFPTPQIGYVVGNGRIFKTTNGATNWTEEWVIGANFFGVSFLNADTGMVLTDNAIRRTADGGTNWNDITPPGTYYFRDIAYPALDTAYVVGGSGLILSTYDGGDTWIQQNSGTTSELTTVSFSSSTNGRASGYDGTILVTLDAGVTWIPEATPSLVQISAVVTTQEGGWASKVDGNLLKFECSAVDSMTVNAYTLNPTSNCTGSVLLSSVSGESFVTNVTGQDQVVQSSENLSGFCEGYYALDGYNSCGNELNGRFVIPAPTHFFGETAGFPEPFVSYLGHVQEFCTDQIPTITSARLLDVSFINSTTVLAFWELIRPSGPLQLSGLYEVDGDGMYAIQLGLYCEDNPFEGLVVSGKIYVENNTVVLNTPEPEMESLTIFPNPASDKITVRFESGTANVIIRDINGKPLLSKSVNSNEELDLSDFSTGILLLEITTEKGTTTKRIVKN